MAKRLRQNVRAERSLAANKGVTISVDRAFSIGPNHVGNIMLTKSGAKLMDFGLAKPTPPGASGAGSAPLFSAART
jgi:hypothetical protein